jgi:hypothetical protein
VDHLALAFGEDPAFSSVVYEAGDFFFNFGGGQIGFAEGFEEEA